MGTKSHSRLDAKADSWEARLLDVLLSTATGQSIVLYEMADGPFADPASSTEQRCAVFEQVWAKDLNEEIRHDMEDRSSWYWFEGLPGAISDVIVQTNAAARDGIQQHRDETRFLTGPRKEGYYQKDVANEQELYVAFLDAIDTIAEDDSNSEAWDTIDRWRNRLMLKHEK